MKYNRVILKISGEALQGTEDIINYDIVSKVAKTIKNMQEAGIQVALVVGGGNIYRGFGKENIEEEKGHYMGMLSTSINALALTSFFNKNGIETVFQNSFEIESVAPKIDSKVALSELEAGKLIVFGGGTGRPFVSTDTGAA
jgi:uridylate kinase